MRTLLAILAALALLLGGCSRRERANPFDPLNPATGGRPAGFVALAGDREVSLRWQAVTGNTHTGYQIFRSGPGDADYRAISSVLSPGATAFRDFPLQNGADYAYRLFYVFAYGLGRHPAEDIATPGAAVPWVIEAAGKSLVRVTPDARRVAARLGGYGATRDVAVHPGTGQVWVADEGSGVVVVYHPTSGVTVTIPGLRLPRAVAVDPYDGRGWVVDGSTQLVHHFTPAGQVASPPIGPLGGPVDVAVDVMDGSVWVCELGAERVARHDSFSQALWTVPVPHPARVAVDSTTREGWVTSYASGTVTRISERGQALATLTGFFSPLGVAVDARRGRIWVADPGAGEVVALRRDGTVEFRVTGLADAGELAVDAGTGEAWAVLANPGLLARLSPAGMAIRMLAGLRAPIAVSVDPGGR